MHALYCAARTPGPKELLGIFLARAIRSKCASRILSSGRSGELHALLLVPCGCLPAGSVRVIYSLTVVGVRDGCAWVQVEFHEHELGIGWESHDVAAG